MTRRRDNRADYNTRPSNSISFMPAVASTSGRLHCELVRIFVFADSSGNGPVFSASGAESKLELLNFSQAYVEGGMQGHGYALLPLTAKTARTKKVCQRLADQDSSLRRGQITTIHTMGVSCDQSTCLGASSSWGSRSAISVHRIDGSGDDILWPAKVKLL